MSRSVDREVAAVDNAVDAAKLREKWTRSLLEDEGMHQDRADSLAEGIDALEDRYPEIMGLAVGEANDFARRQGKGKPDADVLSQAAESAGAEAASRDKDGNPTSGSNGGSSSTRGPGRREVKQRLRKSRSPQVRRYARSAYRQTGIPGATASATSVALSLLGMTVGLSLLYLLLSNAEGSRPGRSAVAQISNGVAGAVQAFILPVDPLRSVKSARAAAAGPAGPPGTKGPTGAPAGPSGPVGTRGKPFARPRPYTP